MKIALVLHGTLRTFLMPTRENPSLRVCDIFINNFIKNNNPDIFISTDSNDFYYNGTQYFKQNENNQIDIVNMDPFRLYHKVGFISFENARNIISEELNKLFGSSIKAMNIKERDEDISNDEKYQLLLNSKTSGSAPGMIVRQYKDLLDCDNLLQNYEKQNNIKYDYIIKCRFDNMYEQKNIDLNKYNFHTTDVYVPGYQDPLIYDFFAFGKATHMRPYLRMYESLGSTLPGPTIMMECRRDGKIVTYGNMPNNNIKCQQCHQSDKLWPGDVTIASEHHLFSLFRKNGTRYANAGISNYIYRYRDTSCQGNIDNIIQNELKLNDITLVNHAPGHKESSKKF